ncbi:MAG: DUF790 family protein [Polyangiaceae bacterium]
MRPLSLLPYTLRDGQLLPHYLSSRDEPWVRLLIDELDALVGRTQGDAAQILNEKAPQIASTHDVPVAAVRAVRHLLERRWLGRRAAGVPSREIRRVVFELGSDPSTPRDDVLKRAGDVLGIRADQVSEGLFADSSSERRLSAPHEEPAPRAIVDEYNQALVQDVLLRSEEVVLHLGAHAAPVLRVIKQRGLMYAFALKTSGAIITLPGPVSLFRQTVRYGRALTALLPAVAALPHWSLDAKCVMGARTARFHADSSDPIVPSPSKDGDSAVERRLVSDFRRLGSRWTISPSSTPLRTSSTTFFPDFTFERGFDRVPVEIIGFHTAAYLKSKLDALRGAGLSSLLLCVDDSLACSERAAITGPNIVHFQKRIETAPLLRALERLTDVRDSPPDSDQPSSEC